MLEICKYLHGITLKHSIDTQRFITTFLTDCITHIKCVVQSDN